MIEDDARVLPSVAEGYRLLKLAPFGALARHAFDAHPCLHVWDPSIPGGAVAPPALILKVRPVRFTLRERSLAAKAETAVTRYIGAYLGTTAEDFPSVERVEVAVALHCPGKRGARRELVAVDEGPDETQVHPLDANGERFARALRQAADDAVGELRKAPDLCGDIPR